MLTAIISSEAKITSQIMVLVYMIIFEEQNTCWSVFKILTFLFMISLCSPLVFLILLGCLIYDCIMEIKEHNI